MMEGARPSPLPAEHRSCEPTAAEVDALRFESIAAVGQRLAHGSVSAVALCDAMLSAIARRNGSLRAYSHVLADTARAEASASDARRRDGATLGPLDGIPIAVKDLIDTSPAICKAGLDHLSRYVPAKDAAVVTRLRSAGAVILGVTETDPGAFSTDTPVTINPLDPMRSAGGSSGGAAAAVAAGLAFAAIGTDTGGSIRIPAACCSIFGFKPTWGRIDMTGIRPLAPSLDHAGPLARSVADLAVVQAVLDSSRPPLRGHDEPIILGICAAYSADADPDILAAFHHAIERLGQRDIGTRGVELPDLDEMLPMHMAGVSKEAADYHTRHFPDEWPNYPEIPRQTIDAGLRTTEANYASVLVHRKVAAEVVDRALSQVDAIVVPTMPIDAPLRASGHARLGGRTMTRLAVTVRYTALFNQTGHPVVSMPATALPDGRALSIQLIGRKDADVRLLELARRLEQDLAFTVDHAGIVERQSASADAVRAGLA